ncbi:Germin-like protein subfamily 1 member 14 [Forsythia ovata]|uniref:Germin-like protein n=1 Tax=Forsythia ovata TaxID=205694 RepID=A0ABD1WVT0_9LAMI
MAIRLLLFTILALASSLAYASDPSPLQDFCVAVNDSNTTVFVNGKICKDPTMVTADDFFFSGLNKAGNTSNPLGSKVTLVNVNLLAGLNTLGISLVRIDYAPYGLIPPHTHPRAAEILVVVQGTLYVGFVTSNPANPNMKNKLFTKTLYPGDVFVFPDGLIHFQFNVGKTKAVAFAGLSSQNPGVITIANSVFGSNPPISSDVLTKAFQVNKNLEELAVRQCLVLSSKLFISSGPWD